MSAGVGVPSSVIAMTVSARRISSARATPASPPAASAHRIGPADEDAAGTERQGGHDVETAPDPAVDPDLGPAADGLDDLLERVGRRDGPIELAGAVVRDDDPVDAVLDGETGVLVGQDALEHERQRRPAPDRREVRPGQAPVEVTSGGCRSRRPRRAPWAAWSGPSSSTKLPSGDGQVEAGAEVALAVAEDGQVDRQDDRAVAGRLGPLDEAPGPARVGLGVELEPADAVGRRGGDVLDRRGRHRRQGERDAGRGGGAGRRELGVRDGPGRGPPSGRSPTGSARRRAEHRRRRVDATDVDEDARPEPAPAPRRVGLGERLLVPGAAGDVVERAAGPSARAASGLELGERDDPREVERRVDRRHRRASRSPDEVEVGEAREHRLAARRPGP